MCVHAFQMKVSTSHYIDYYQALGNISALYGALRLNS